MLKKIVVGALIVVVMGAVGVGIIDAAQGRSVAAQDAVSSVSQADDTGCRSGTRCKAVVKDRVGGRARIKSQDQTSAQGQGQGYRGGQGQSADGQGQTQNPNAGTPQANVTDWMTVTGTVNSFDGVGVSLTTDDGAPLWVQFGQSRYVTAQGVTFTAGDHLTVNGFMRTANFRPAR